MNIILNQYVLIYAHLNDQKELGLHFKKGIFYFPRKANSAIVITFIGMLCAYFSWEIKCENIDCVMVTSSMSWKQNPFTRILYSYISTFQVTWKDSWEAEKGAILK